MFGLCWQTVYRRFAWWSRAQVWGRLHRVILVELGARGEPSRCAIDSVSIRAAERGRTLTGPDRSRQERIEDPLAAAALEGKVANASDATKLAEARAEVNAVRRAADDAAPGTDVGAGAGGKMNRKEADLGNGEKVNLDEIPDADVVYKDKNGTVHVKEVKNAGRARSRAARPPWKSRRRTAGRRSSASSSPPGTASRRRSAIYRRSPMIGATPSDVSD
ncbi:predicted protein [Streptomyces viridochromogenes DSM 40736]|uniref:Predicted protein n=1 Tax=Streptomyces viridochromogenes (strain DSM 40736 / JCM 4977 / BCRC 1201 / Tue 494) TaxID=591159 RepID=D9XCU0_STRVT|nr:predicted protein [Streptomyces viridochromogenes DSM 40736]